MLQARRVLPAIILVGVLAGVAAPAAAEGRTTAITVGGWSGSITNVNTFADDGIGGIAVALDWEVPRIEMPATPAYAYRFAWAPELHGGILEVGATGESFIAVGFRAALDLAQREKGLARVSARSSAYVAGRLGVIGDDQTPMYSVVLGAHVSPGTSTRLRLGLEFGAIGLDNAVYGDSSGGLVTFYLGSSL